MCLSSHISTIPPPFPLEEFFWMEQSGVPRRKQISFFFLCFSKVKTVAFFFFNEHVRKERMKWKDATQLPPEITFPG